jgi:hypothetical protein
MDSTIVERFSKYLTQIKYPKKEDSWHIEGILINSNQSFKFDVRNMFALENNQFGKYVNTANKADKIVFETNKNWYIIDIIEFNKYIKKNKLSKVHLEDLLMNLDWCINLKK